MNKGIPATTENRCDGLDAFKLIAAFLVVAIHTSPLSSFQTEADFFLTRILARVAVPFFFMVTGHFILSNFLSAEAHPLQTLPSVSMEPIWRYIKKVLILYGIATLLYLPVGIYAGHYDDWSLSSLLRMLLFDGTFYHLWYFPGLIAGILLLCLFRRFFSFRCCALITAGLYLLGLLGDSYWGLIADIPVISTIYEWGFQIFSYTRNGLFFAPIFLLMGASLGGTARRNNAKRAEPQNNALPRDAEQKTACKTSPALKPSSVCKNALGFAAAFLLMTAEGFLLHHFDLQRHDSMYLMLPVCMFFLYPLLMAWNPKPIKQLPLLSTWIYILHPAMIVVVRGVAKIFPITDLLMTNSLIHYLAVCILSFLAACFVLLLRSAFQFSHRNTP